MPSKTPNYQLNIYDNSITDGNTDFIDYRLKISGTGADSNFVIIDSVLAELSDKIKDIPVDTNSQYSFSISGNTIKIQKKEVGEGTFTDYQTIVLPIPDLSSYATKVYVDNAISGVTQFDYQKVDVLPSTGVKGTIYLVPSGQSAPNVYDEYLWLDDAWEIIGTTQIDLSGYVKTEDMNAALSKKVSGTDTTTAGNVANFGQDGYSVVDSGYKIEKSVPADAKFTDTDTGITTVVANDGLTQSINGRTLTLGLSSKIVSSVHDITYSEGTVSGDSVVFTINHNLGTSILNMNIVKTNAPVIYLSPLYP